MNVSLLSSLIGLFSGNQSSQGLPLSNRNYIVDGNFDQWIATSVTTSAGVATNGAATMYYNNPGTSGVATVTQQAFAGSEPTGMTSPVKYFMRHAQTTAGTSPSISQRVESVQTLQGRYATLSCWLRCSSGSATISSVGITQTFGTGGSPNANVSNNVAVNWVLTTQWQRFSVLVPLASTSGLALGTAGNDCLYVQLTLPSASTFTVDTAQWQLEQSSPQAGTVGAPTAFEYRGYQPELRRVMRYYRQVSYPAGAFLNGIVTGATNAFSFNEFEEPMRATPTTAPTASFTFVATGTWNTGGSATAQSPTQWYLALAGSGGVQGQAGYFNATAAGAITFDARL